MSAPHTPGPWEACNPGDYSDFDGYSRVVCSADPDDMRRIAVVHWSARYPENDANAHLIATAPELLELACQYLSDLHHPPQGDSLKRRIERAEKIIAKARGQ